MGLGTGESLGPYEIVAPLGAGGMGEVYRAIDHRLSREVAIKVLPNELAGDAERRARFEREARAAGCLNHPNLLVVHDVGWNAVTPFLVTELLRGQSLKDRLCEGPLPLRIALDVATQFAAGLAAAHRQGVVHRDLKPANLFLADEGRLKILDFGLAKLPQPADLAAAPTLIQATTPGMILGTVPYMAPEQLRGEPLDARCDVFAFGVVCCEMLSGVNPFTRDTSAETIAAILHDDHPLERLPAVPPGLRSLLSQCLAKRREERPASAELLVAALQGLATVRPRKRRRAIEALAVLPFAAEGVPEEAEYLADGITEGLIHALAGLPRLRVMARSTVFRFKGTAADPRAVGAELGVGAVLSGRVGRRGDQLLINAELVNVADGALLWDERLSRPLSQLVDTEKEIADQLAARLRPKLAGGTRRPAPRPTRDSAAYQAYLRGRFLWNRWTPEGVRASISHYEQALAIDPRFAMAHAGLADSWAVLGNIKAVPPVEAYPRAKAAALAALTIDDRLAAAHASLGYVRWLFDWDWPAAEDSFQRAIEADADYATGRRWYGQFLSSRGRREEALREVRWALDLEPLSLVIHTAVGDVLFYARRYTEALPYYRRAIELDPVFPGHSDLARALEHLGRLEEAIAEYQTAVKLGGDSAPDPSVGLATVYALSGRHQDATLILEELLARRERGYVSPWGIASIHAVLGDDGAALDWLERAYAEHDSPLVWIKVHPRFDRLRSQPDFEALVRRMGFAD